MPDLDRNYHMWERKYDWGRQGEEWSAPWGGSRRQWFHFLLPRLQRWLPAETMLELGPGRGRWTHFLKDHTQRFIGLDLSPACVEACRSRFRADAHCEFHATDGRTLGPAPAGGVDLVFSFDVLVHAEADVLQAYLGQLAGILRPGGAAFWHHSNLAACPDLLADPEAKSAWRAESVSAERVSRWCDAAGLRCIGQELFGLEKHPERFLDCISLIVRADSPEVRPNRVLANTGLWDEIARARRLAEIYDDARP